MKPIEDWKTSFRYLTVQFGAALALFGTLPAGMQQEAITWALSALHIPPERVPLVLGIAVILLRNIRQKPKDGGQ